MYRKFASPVRTHTLARAHTHTAQVQLTPGGMRSNPIQNRFGGFYPTCTCVCINMYVYDVVFSHIRIWVGCIQTSGYKPETYQLDTVRDGQPTETLSNRILLQAMPRIEKNYHICVHTKEKAHPKHQRITSYLFPIHVYTCIYNRDGIPWSLIL